MESTTVPLPATFDVRSVTAAHGQFVTALASGDSLVVDGSRVERLDSCAAQLLVALARESRVTWRLSPPLRAQLESLSLSSHFKEEGSP